MKVQYDISRNAKKITGIIPARDHKHPAHRDIRCARPLLERGRRWSVCCSPSVMCMCLRSSIFSVSASDIRQTPCTGMHKRLFFTDKDQIIPDAYTTCFQSVTACDRIQVVGKDEERWNAIEKPTIKHAPKATVHSRTHAIHQEWNALCLLKMTIELIWHKQSAR